MEVKVKDIVISLKKVKTVLDKKSVNKFSTIPAHKHFKHSVEIVLKNNSGEQFKHIVEYIKYDKEFPISDEFFLNVLEEIIFAYRIKSGVYESFEDFCEKEKHILSPDNQEDYFDAVKIGDGLNKILNDKWIEDVSDWVLLIRKMTF